jgi:hypothetical protein
MTAVAMIGTPGATGVAMGSAMTIVGVMIAASVMPTGDGTIAWMTTADGTTGVSARATDDATIATSGTTIDAVEPDRLLGPSGFWPGRGLWVDLGLGHSNTLTRRGHPHMTNVTPPA